jgi:gliding motility-associated-like protein
MQVQGNFVLQLKRGTDGNTLLNECGEETPVGSFISFSVKDTVNADFTYTVNYGCTQDVVDFSHPGSNGVNNWKWNLSGAQQSTLQNPTATYLTFTPKNIQLIVTNGFCSDTTSKILTLDNYMKADFNVFEDNCPNEPVPFTSTSVGKIVSHDWSFGDGTTGTGANAVHTYSTPGGTRTYTVIYTATDSFGCTQTVSKPIKVYTSCVLDVPNAFTPNTDGHNDFLYPLNAVKAVDLEFTVYNRWGQLMFKSKNWKIGWDGRVGGKLQPSGAYVWMLKYTDRDTQKEVFRKGTAVLIR